MKRMLKFTMALVLAASVFAGCSASSTETTETTGTTETTETTESTETTEATEETTGAMEGAITVVSREDGSGTRGAFVELFGVEQENEAGEKEDMTTLDAIITNSTSVMMTTVAGDPAAIGYISLGSLNDTVKAVNVDGAKASVETIKSGEYKVSRPFNVVKKGELSEAAQDFLNFILSTEGQAIAEENGYIPNDGTEAFAGGNVSGKVVVMGSSSVTPVMEKWKEGYIAINPNVEIEVQQSDSTTGVNSVLEGICDLGMASRALKDSEVEGGAEGIVAATDGIAVIVNNENPISDISSETVKNIFVGDITDWSEVQ